MIDTEGVDRVSIGDSAELLIDGRVVIKGKGRVKKLTSPKTRELAAALKGFEVNTDPMEL